MTQYVAGIPVETEPPKTPRIVVFHAGQFHKDGDCWVDESGRIVEVFLNKIQPDHIVEG